MRQSVRDAFVPFTARFEGVVHWMYLDIKGLVTTAIGNLIDPMDEALTLPFMRPGGYTATQDEIAAEWTNVKAMTNMTQMGGGAFGRVTTLRLTDDGIKQVVAKRLDQNNAYLLTRFHDYESWPADAQLGLLSMAWAAGPAFRAPLFEGFCKSQDFIGAAIQCRFNDSANPGLRPRNDANQLLFKNAAQAIANGDDLDALYYPATLMPIVAV